MIEWLTCNNASVATFACEFRCVKNDCRLINYDFSSLTFQFLSSLFGGKSVPYSEQFESASQLSPSLEKQW